MVAWEGRKYKLEKSEKFEEYMKALGVGMMIRKLANSVKPVVDLTKDGDEYSLTSSTTVRTTILKFKSGIEFEQETMDGRKVLTTCTFETPNKLVQVEKGNKPVTIVREFTETDLTMTFTFGDIVCVRYYKVVN